MKKFCFTVDDNIRFFQALSTENADSLFSNPYAKMVEHIKTVEEVNAEAVLKEMDKVKALAEIQNNPYQYVRDWFLKKYPDVRPAA